MIIRTTAGGMKGSLDDEFILTFMLMKSSVKCLVILMMNSLPGHSLCLALDDVQDPGNLGTIIRIATGLA